MANDPLAAVDALGAIIRVGSLVNITKCTVVGLRVAPDNRLNVWVIPASKTIVTADPGNILNGQLDGKALLVCGYNCITVPLPGGNTDANLAASYQAAMNAVSVPATIGLPSNFRTPSII
jgi:hypothetical protein